MRERNREKEEWRLELGFGEGEQKFWELGLILPWKIEIGFYQLIFFYNNYDDLKIMMAWIEKQK